MGGGMSSVVQIGPWGSESRSLREIEVAPQRLETITVRHGDVVDALGFSYKDHHNLSRPAGPWGGTGGGLTTIRLGDTEFVTGVSGTHGSYYGHPCIARLTFVTNLGRRYGPFGNANLQEAGRFSFPVKNGSIVGFFVHTGSLYVSAIGFYVRTFSI